MILVDTSVWIDHFRTQDEDLMQVLNDCRALVHPMVIGELACGNLQQRPQTLGLLNNLPASKQASHEEALFFVEQRHLYGKGIGWIDSHLLASCALTQGCLLWTRDKRLQQIAQQLSLCCELG